MKLTIKSTDAAELPAGKADFVFWDDDTAGFGLRVRAGGSRTWVYRYRVGAKQRAYNLGSAKSVPLVTARRNAQQLEARVRIGEDPALDKQLARTEVEHLTGALIDAYLDERHTEWRSSTQRQQRYFLSALAKPLHDFHVDAISQLNISKLLTAVAEKNGHIAANRLRAALATFFAWCIKRGIRLPDGNVVAATGKRKEASRDRVLSDPEIRALWHALGDDDYGAILKLLLLTGQRRAEIGSLRWSEVSDNAIALPRERTKNDKAHTVPLSKAARDILNNRRVAGRVFVFGRNDTNGFLGWGSPKERLDARLGKEFPEWNVHDLRRSCASGMQKLGIRFEVIERALNHRSGVFRGVAGVYQVDLLEADVRVALDKWAKHVLAVVQ